MAAAQLTNICKEIVTSLPEFFGLVQKQPDFSKALGSIKQAAATRKAMSLDEVLLLNHAMFWIMTACAVLTATVDSITAILGASPPPIISSLISVLFTVIAAALESHMLWFVAAKKKGDGFTGPLTIFGPWWLFCLGLALAMQAVMGMVAIVLTSMSLVGIPSLQTVTLASSLVSSLVQVIFFSSMAHGVLHNNKAYDVSQLLAHSTSGTKRGREAEKTGAKKRSETPTPTAKTD